MRWLLPLLVTLDSSLSLSDIAHDESAFLQVSVKSSKSAAPVDNETLALESKANRVRSQFNVKSGEFFEKEVQLEKMRRQLHAPNIFMDKCKLQFGSNGMYVGSRKDLEDSCSALWGDLHKSKQEALVELELAKERVATLEPSLAAPDMRASDIHRQGSQTELQEASSVSSLWRLMALHITAERAILFISFLATATYAVREVLRYERGRGELDEPWFHDAECLTKVFGAGVSGWIIVGTFFFTEILLFTDAERHLTLSEALYVNSQIITTIGYGELTVSNDYGCFFMMFYATIAVMVSGVFFQHFVLLYFERSEDTDLVANYSPRQSLAPVLICLLSATFFFAFYPGEEKTISECMYMSVITFLTVGFGDYHPETEVGRAVGAVWMFLGVAFTGKAILDFTQYLYHHRRSLRSRAAAVKTFDEIDKTHRGYIDKAQFLTFKLVQEGILQSQINKILAKFDDFDLEHDGTLTFKEFKTYADSLEPM